MVLLVMGEIQSPERYTLSKEIRRFSYQIKLLCYVGGNRSKNSETSVLQFRQFLAVKATSPECLQSGWLALEG
jgi:hypothetical protein